MGNSNIGNLKAKSKNSCFQPTRSSKKVYVQIIKPTVTKDRLLDLEAKCVIKDVFVIPLFFSKHEQKISRHLEEETTFKFEISNKQLCIDYISKSKSDENNPLDERCWVVLNNRFFPDYVPSDFSDILKLGNIILTVAELKIIKPQKNSSKKSEDIVSIAPPITQEASMIMESSETDSEKPSMKTCKYCLETVNSDDVLISPCKCKGSMRFVHRKCLKQWGMRKVFSVENDYITILFWEDLKCDLCQTPLYEVFGDSEEMFSMAKGHEINFSFVAMKTAIKTKHYIFFMNLDKKKSISIGKLSDCQIRLEENSISDHHARIFVDNDEVFVEDLGSKFGTLILYKEPFCMENILMEFKELCLEYCGFLMKFSLKKSKMARI